ncbi:MAG: hypothetical protein ABIL61_07500 [candidate division WOR-3 bacterium]
MMRSLILAATLAALLLFGCKRSETIKEVAQDDINFSTQAVQEVTQSSVGNISDPGAPVGLSRYTGGFFLYRYTGGFFLYSNEYVDEYVDLRQKGCVSYNPADTTDSDGDKVYTNAAISFNCNGTDTIIRNSKEYKLDYQIVGTLNHNDPDTLNPFIFSSSWGNPFKFYVKITDLSTNTSEEFDNEQAGNISMEKVQDGVYRLIRNLKYAKQSSNCRFIQVTETTYVFLDQAPNWHPGDTLGSQTIKTWPIGKGKLVTCSGVEVNLSFVPTDTLKIAKCPSGSVGITSGNLLIRLELPTGTQEFQKSFSCSQ